MHKARVLNAILCGLVLGSFAATDENGLVPRAWLKFDGAFVNDGQINLNLTSQNFKYAASRRGMAGYDSMPFGSSGGYGKGDWTVVETARLSATAGDIVWAFGKKDSANGLALVSGGTAAVWLCTWTQEQTTKLLEAAVADAAAKFHNYVVVVSPGSKTATLWIDGATQPEWTVAIGGNPGAVEYQYGGIHGGQPSDGVLNKSGKTYHDDWRLYHKGLSESEITAIAAAHPVWPDREITEATILTDASEPWTGNASVLLRANLTLQYDLLTHNKLADFSGDLILDSGVKLASEQTVWDESQNPLGGARIVFAGGQLEGFLQRNNVTIPNAIVVNDGTASRFTSWRSANGSGCNTTLTGKLSGSGKLTIRDEDRWVKLSGDLSAFTGELVVHLKGRWTSSTLATIEAGSPLAHYTFETEGGKQIILGHPDGTTLKLGDLTLADASDLKIEKNSSVQIGSRNGTSLIDAPITNKRLDLVKVGSGTLTLGSKVTTLADSSVAAKEGKVIVNGTLPNVTITVSDTGSVAGNAETGLLAANLVYAEGSRVEIPLVDGKPTERSYPIVTVAAGYTAAGRPAVADVKGLWKTRWIANADGSQTLTAYNANGLVVLVK